MKLMLAIYFLAMGFAVSGDLGPSLMENGDRIEFTEHSVGCFHNTTSYYEIRKNNGVYSFGRYAITWEKGIPPRIKEKQFLGAIQLALKDVLGLDELLKFYRSKKTASSTTQSSLLVEYYESGRRVRGESLYDESDGYGLENRKDVVTFFALVSRFGKKGAANAAGPAPAKPGD